MSFYRLVLAAPGPQTSSQRPSVASVASTGMGRSVVRDLLAEPLVQSIAEAAYQRASRGTVPDRKIEVEHLSAFLQQLSVRKEELIRLLATEAAPEAQSTDGPNFRLVLLSYLKAYGSGEFVSRDGTNIAKPQFSGGVSDDDIQGLSSVFFEAFFDCLYSDMPVFATHDSGVEPVDTPGPTIPPPSNPEPVTRAYQRRYFDNYLTPDNATPTAASEGSASLLYVDVPNALINKRQVKALQRLGKLSGRQAKSLSGAAFGFLSNINVSFVLGADFAIGDNDTLLHLVQSIAEVSARRTSQYVAYRAISHSADAKSAGSTSTSDPELLELVSALEDAN